MKTVLLMRHAKSSWHESTMSDHDRPLNARGLRAAPLMGESLLQRGLVPDFILTSSATRALETAKAVARTSGYAGSLEVTPRLYLAEPAAYLETLSDVPADKRCVLVVGHNPGISDLLLLLTGQEKDMPTAAIAHLRLHLSEFAALGSDTRGELVEFWRPREEKNG